MPLLAAAVLLMGPQIELTTDVVRQGEKLMLQVHGTSTSPKEWSIDPSRIKFRVNSSLDPSEASIEIKNAPAKVSSDLSGALHWESEITLNSKLSDAAWITVKGFAENSIIGIDRKQVKETPPPANPIYRADLDPSRLVPMQYLVGKKVWVFGGSGFYTTPGAVTNWDITKPVKVLGVDFADGPINADGVIGQQARQDETSGWRPTSFRVGTPLRIKVQFAPPSFKGGAPEVAFIDLADAWMVPYLLSLKPPSQELAKRLWLDPEVDTGMSKQLLVWLHGYPRFDIPIKDLWEKKTWTYYGPVPHGNVVKFDKNNKISEIEGFGDMP